MSPTLASGSLITGPPGKVLDSCFDIYFYICKGEKISIQIMMIYQGEGGRSGCRTGWNQGEKGLNTWYRQWGPIKH